MKNSKKNILIDNINSKRKDLNLRVSQLSKISGVSDKTLRKILDGSTQNPTISNVSRCAKALGCTTSDLIGETKMLSYQEDLLLDAFGKLDDVAKEAVFEFMKTCLQIQNSTESKVVVIKQIPFFQQKVSAGIGNYLDSSNYDYISVSSDQIPDENVFALQVSGDSMEPTLSDEDYILIEPTEELEEGDIGVFVVNDESYIKRYAPGQLISINDAYEPINLSDDDNVRVIGKFVDKVVPEE